MLVANGEIQTMSLDIVSRSQTNVNLQYASLMDIYEIH